MMGIEHICKNKHSERGPTPHFQIGELIFRLFQWWLMGLLLTNHSSATMLHLQCTYSYVNECAVVHCPLQKWIIKTALGTYLIFFLTFFQYGSSDFFGHHIYILLRNIGKCFKIYKPTMGNFWLEGSKSLVWSISLFHFNKLFSITPPPPPWEN